MADCLGWFCLACGCDLDGKEMDKFNAQVKANQAKNEAIREATNKMMATGGFTYQEAYALARFSQETCPTMGPTSPEMRIQMFHYLINSGIPEVRARYISQNVI
jgi:hypothetical protein